MSKLLSNKNLQKGNSKLKDTGSDLMSESLDIPFNIHPKLFFQICEYSKNAVAIFESPDNGKSFIIKYFNKKAEEIEKVNRQNIIDKNLVEIFPSIKTSGFLKALQRVFKNSIAEEFPAIAFSSGKLIEWKQNYIYKLSDKEIVSIFLDETLNKTKEFELLEHQEKLQLAMEAANYFSFEIQLKDYKIITPPELYHALGYKGNNVKVLMKKAGSLIHPQDYEMIKNSVLDHVNGLKPSVNLEFRIKDHSNKWVWFKANGRIIEWDKKSKPSKLVGLIRNVQEEKEIQFKLKQSQEKFKSLATLLPEVVYETDEKGNITFVNLKAYEIFEYEPNDLMRGLNIFQMIAPEDLERAKSNFSRLIKEGNLSGEEYLAITKSGEKFPILVYSNLIREDNEIKGFRGIIVNISELKKAQEQLAASEENFRQLAENINDAFWLRSLDHKIIYGNPACYKVICKNFENIFENFDAYKNWIHPEDRERIIKQREKNLKNPEKEYFYEHRVLKADGSVRWLWIRTFPVYNSKGKLYRRAGIASDISEQKKLLSDLIIAKEKAEESDQLKSSFLANMSHEIRTPMNGILGFTELLKDDDISQKDKSDYLRIINSNGKQLLNLIDDIIDVAKIEAEQLSINKKIFEINAVMEEIYQVFFEEKKRYNKEDIEFTLQIPGNNNTIFTDESRIKQIFNNLLSNAFKFTRSGSISFGYRLVSLQNDTKYQFFVKDTGIGINSKMNDLIFERFGQIQSKIPANYQGTGLGLAISKGLVELLNGEIWFESIPQNLSIDQKGGSTFYFTIPADHIKGSNEPKDEEFKAKRKMKNLDNAHILVVEDDNDNLELLNRFLQKFGATVILARSGSEAIEAVKSNRHIQLVLMDIRLPDIDGFETTQQIKAINPNLPVIAQTAYAMYNDRELCLRNGCDDYMSKPLDKDILYQKINHYIYN